MLLKPADHGELLQRWLALGQQVSLTHPDWQAEGRRLIRSWSRWPRKYHNTTHLLACLKHFSQVSSQLQNPLAVEMAVWFHDAIYCPWLARNEEKSAEWALRFLQKIGFDAAFCQLVSRHILDTRHQAIPGPGDAQWVIDIDLAVLGQNETVYRQFEKDVRSEYRWVRWSRYVKGRSAVLQSFLDRPRIYNTPWFFERYESAARANLQQAIVSLADGRLY